MSDMGKTVDCESFDEAIAELALEILEPGEREAVLAHVATCDRCAAELQHLSAAADRLTLLAPDCEPPVGFEQRVMDALGESAVRPVRPVRPLRSVRPMRLWQLAAAAAVLFVVGVAAGFLAQRQSGSDADPLATNFRYSDLVDDDGGRHGSVSLVADDDGSAPVVLTMTLSDLEVGVYDCVVHFEDGSTADVAYWPIDETGFGTWAIPVDSALGDIRAVSATDAAGSTVAVTDWP